MTLLHHRREKHRKHRKIAFHFFVANSCLAVLWGPVFIGLTLAGPLRDLSSRIIWVAVISYYANMMGNLATAAGLWASIKATDAATQAIDNAERVPRVLVGYETRGSAPRGQL